MRWGGFKAGRIEKGERVRLKEDQKREKSRIKEEEEEEVVVVVEGRRRRRRREERVIA